MTTLHHPDPTFTGPIYLGPTIADFRGGLAIVRVPLHKAVVARLEAAGYHVGDSKPLPEAEPAVVDPLAMTVPQLRDFAAERGIEVPSKARKVEIIETIAAALAERSNVD